MTKRTLGVLTGVIGTALGAWWWSRQRGTFANHNLTPARERGTVIFDNTPAASPESSSS